MIEQFLQDLRSGCRVLWMSPGFSATVILSLALVIGGNTTVYSMVHAWLTKPAVGVEAEGLVHLGLTIDGRPDDLANSYPNYKDFVTQSKALQALIAIGFERFTLILREQSYAFDGALVTSNYFDTLGVPLAKGRTFTEEESAGASALVAVIGYNVWQEHFGGAEDILGRPITLNGHAATIVGVAPPRFQGTGGGAEVAIWAPLVGYHSVDGTRAVLEDRATRSVYVMGALAPQSDIADAQAEFFTISQRLEAAYPEPNKGKVVTIAPYSAHTLGIDGRAQQVNFFMAILTTVTMLTLMIVCANVGNLTLARSVVRQRESALRQSLGASRVRIIRVIVAEGLALSLVAWAASCFVAVGVSYIVPRMVASPLDIDLAPDWRVVAYAIVLALVATLVFTLGPAIRTWRQDVLPWLKAGEHTVAQGRSKLSSAFVVMQLAFSVVLLTSAGLVYRAVALVDTVDMGFNTTNLLLVGVEMNGVPQGSAATVLDGLQRRLQTLPTVSAVSYEQPAGGQRIERNPQEFVQVQSYAVGPDHLRVFGLNPIAGRELSEQDRGDVAVINKALADALWPGQPALGRSFLLGRDRRLVEVVGVAPDASYRGGKTLVEPVPNFIFLPAEGGQPEREITFRLRYTGDLATVVSAVRTGFNAVDVRVAITSVDTLEAQLSNATSTLRVVTVLITLFSTICLLITTIGQYGVIAFNMRRRTRDFGVRMAIGASPAQIRTSVLREGLWLTAIGLTVGFNLSIAAGTVIGGVLYGVTSTDPITYLGVFGLLAVASLVACYIPARRASQVDPMKALREN